MPITLVKLAPHRCVARLDTHEAEGHSPLSAIHELEAVLHDRGLRVVETPEIEPEQPKANASAK